MTDEPRRARNLAFKYLVYRNRTRHEMQTYLARKGVEPETAGQVLEFLEKLHYIDDTRFARDWGRCRIRDKKIGRRRLKQELLAKGVEPGVVAPALEELFAEIDEWDLARQCAKKKLASMPRRDPGKARRRLAGYLYRKGFPGDMVYNILDQLVPLGSD